ncbi:hypothetical protein [Staphylococcus pasteuri]|uniref:hypothetical protein n=1 Tax=Staphylococcus pasteuri TaxID=45972 RepID=UPI001C3FADCF|nr:hypothetical protein [Staphylococcus pasteuri]
MKQFIYISLLCGVISGAGVFFNMPHYPSFIIPRIVAIVGVINAILTIRDKESSFMLSIGGIMINLLPLLGSFLPTH